MSKRPDLADRNRRNAKHGMTGTRTHSCWAAMRERCNRKNHPFYHRYGGRGIAVCERWNEFLNFLEDMGEMPEGMSLDRIDNDKGYSPENCRWATHAEQCNNTSNNRPITAFGRTQNLKQWAREYGMSHQALRHRLNAGWGVERALTTPLDKGNAYKIGTRVARTVEAFGRSMTISEWAKCTGLKYITIFSRLYDGWTPEEALSAMR